MRGEGQQHIEKGEEVVDGTRLVLVYRHLRGAETQDALAIAIPDAEAIIVQDLIYHQALTTARQALALEESICKNTRANDS
jgi:hypothetical protein